MTNNTNFARSRGIRRDALETVGFQAVTYGLTILQGIVIARWLGPAGRGTFYLAALCAGLFLTVFGGLSAAVAHQVSKKNAPVADVMVSGALVSLFLSALPLVAIVIGRFYWRASNNWLAFSSVAAILGLFVACFNGLFLGVSDIRGLNYSQVINTSISFSLVIVLVLGLRMGVRSALSAWLIASACTVIWMWIRSGLTFRRVLTSTGHISTAWAILWFALKIGITNAVGFLNFRADSFLIERFVGVKQLGIYSVAVGIAEVPWFISRALSTAAYGRLGRDSMVVAAQLTAKTLRHTGAALVLVSACLGALAPLLVPIIYGPAFKDAFPVLLALLPGNVCFGLASVFSAYFTNHLGRPEISFAVAGLSVVIDIVGCCLLIPRYGMIGGALASTVAYVVGIMIVTWLFFRTANVSWQECFLLTKSEVSYQAKLVCALLGRN